MQKSDTSGQTEVITSDWLWSCPKWQTKLWEQIYILWSNESGPSILHSPTRPELLPACRKVTPVTVTVTVQTNKLKSGKIEIVSIRIHRSCTAQYGLNCMQKTDTLRQTDRFRLSHLKLWPVTSPKSKVANPQTEIIDPVQPYMAWAAACIQKSDTLDTLLHAQKWHLVMVVRQNFYLVIINPAQPNTA